MKDTKIEADNFLLAILLFLSLISLIVYSSSLLISFILLISILSLNGKILLTSCPISTIPAPVSNAVFSSIL